jgi:hypothetical protein
MLDLAKVSQYWDSLNGTIYVPTRAEPVFRKQSLASALTITTAREQKAIEGGYRLKDNVFEADPIARRLLSTYYTSLEVIFISKIVGWVVEYCSTATGVAPRPPIGLVQGIHDELMFVTSAEVNLAELHSYVNERLAEAILSSVGLALSISLTSTENPNWLAEFFQRDEEESHDVDGEPLKGEDGEGRDGAD